MRSGSELGSGPSSFAFRTGGQGTQAPRVPEGRARAPVTCALEAFQIGEDTAETSRELVDFMKGQKNS